MEGTVDFGWTSSVSSPGVGDDDGAAVSVSDMGISWV